MNMIMQYVFVSLTVDIIFIYKNLQINISAHDVKKLWHYET